MKRISDNFKPEPTRRLGDGCRSQGQGDELARELAGLYDEPVSDDEAALMADRLTGFVGLLLEIEMESKNAS